MNSKNISPDLPLVLKPVDVADAIGISKDYARQIFRETDFPSVTIGKRRVVMCEDFLAWLDSKSDKEEAEHV